DLGKAGAWRPAEQPLEVAAHVDGDLATREVQLADAECLTVMDAPLALAVARGRHPVRGRGDPHRRPAEEVDPAGMAVETHLVVVAGDPPHLADGPGADDFAREPVEGKAEVVLGDRE